MSCATSTPRRRVRYCRTVSPMGRADEHGAITPRPAVRPGHVLGRKRARAVPSNRTRLVGGERVGPLSDGCPGSYRVSPVPFRDASDRARASPASGFDGWRRAAARVVPPSRRRCRGAPAGRPVILWWTPWATYRYPLRCQPRIAPASRPVTTALSGHLAVCRQRPARRLLCTARRLARHHALLASWFAATRGERTEASPTLVSVNRDGRGADCRRAGRRSVSPQDRAPPAPGPGPAAAA